MNERIKRALAVLGAWFRRPPGPREDPHAWRPVTVKSPPKGRSGAVAVAEPDER